MNLIAPKRRPWHRPKWAGEPVVIRRWHLLLSGFTIGVIMAGVISFTAHLATVEAERLEDQRRTDAQLAELVRQELCTAEPEICDKRRQETIIDAIRVCAKDDKCLTELRQTAGPSRKRLLAHAREAVRLYCAQVGCQGPAGPRGAPGPKGDRGAGGQRGKQGQRGKEGRRGATGKPGREGPRGEQGPAGQVQTVVEKVGPEAQDEARDVLCDVLTAKSPLCR